MAHVPPVISLRKLSSSQAKLPLISQTAKVRLGRPNLFHERYPIREPAPPVPPSPAPPAPLTPALSAWKPQIYLVEEFQLVTVGGDLGVMPTVVASVNVMPNTTIKKYLTTKKSQRVEGTFSSSAVESQDSVAAKALSDSVRSSTSSASSRETFDYEMEGSMEAEASWQPLGGSASGSVTAKTSSTGVHDTFRAAVDTAVDSQVSQSESRHAQSETRVTSTQSTDTSTESSEEYVLANDTNQAQNFYFQKVSQERITALCLVDAKVRLINGSTRRIEDYPLSQIDAVLGKAIAPEHREEVKQGILQHLTTVYNYEDEPMTFLETIDRGGVPMIRVVKDLRTTIKIPRSDGQDRTVVVPGIAIQSDVRLLPTGQLAIARGVAG